MFCMTRLTSRLRCLAFVCVCLLCNCHGRRARSSTRLHSLLAESHNSLKDASNMSSRHSVFRVNQPIGQVSARGESNPPRAFATLLVKSAAAYNPSIAGMNFFSSHPTLDCSCQRAFQKRNRLGCCTLAQTIKNGQLVKVEEPQESLQDSSVRFWAAAAALNERRPDFAEMRSDSSIKFWALDMSAGAGAISSPVLDEHPVTILASPTLMIERFFAWLFDRAPQWLLFSTVGVLTREIASRSVLDSIPEWQQDPEAKRKAASLAKTLKTKFNTAVKNTLAPANYGSARNFLQRFVTDQYEELTGSTEIVQRAAGIYEEEVTGFVQKFLGDALKLNESSAEADLGEVLRTVDQDGDNIITVSELFTQLTGQTLPKEVQARAEQTPVLKSANVAKDRWERWRSLVIAPWVKTLIQTKNLLQRSSKVMKKLYVRSAQEVKEIRRVAIAFFDAEIVPRTGLPSSEVLCEKIAPLKHSLDSWAAQLQNSTPAKRFNVIERDLKS
mmetsp:Transcript_13400/g.23547  ORF Transcript_13400/g.23547 Transcript_13400/m.23547 type:complete len:499 (+) Transcript_13400:96-1592(+)